MCQNGATIWIHNLQFISVFFLFLQFPVVLRQILRKAILILIKYVYLFLLDNVYIKQVMQWRLWLS